jgi:hypothetical protein
MDNGHEPATKADLVALEQHLTGDLTALEQRLTGDLAALEQRLTQSLTETLTEAVRDSETRLLKAFYGFTESVQARFKAADDSEANFKKRLGVIEERLLEVEKKLNFPGH